MKNFFRFYFFNKDENNSKSSEIFVNLPLVLFILPVICSFILIFIKDFSIKPYEFYWQFSANIIPLLIDIVSVGLLLTKLPDFVNIFIRKIRKKNQQSSDEQEKIPTEPVTFQKFLFALPLIVLVFYASGLFISLFPVLGTRILSFIVHSGIFIFFLRFRDSLTINLGNIKKPSKFSLISLILIPLGFGISFAEEKYLNLTYYLVLLGFIMSIIFLKKLNQTDYSILLISLIVGIGLVRIFYGSTVLGRTDIHTEIHVANLTISNNGWSSNASLNTYNSVLSITVLPFLAFRIFNITPILYYGLINPILSAFFVVMSFRLACQITSSKQGESTRENNQKITLILILIAGLIQTGTHQLFSNNRSLVAFGIFILLLSKTFPDLIKNDTAGILKKYKSNFCYQLILWLCMIISHWGTAIVGFIFFLIYYIILMVRLSKKSKKILISLIVFMVLILSFGIIWYSTSTFIKSLINDLFQGVFNFIANPSIGVLVYNNSFLRNLLFLNSSINIYAFFESFLYLITIVLPLVSVIITSIHYFSKTKESKVPKHEFKILLLVSFMYYLTNGALLIIPGIQQLYGANRAFYQGLFFYAYIGYYGFYLLEGSYLKITKIKKLKISAKNILTFILIFTFIFHQGILHRITTFTSNLDADWQGDTLFEQNSIEFCRWYSSDKDILAFQWIRENRTGDFIYSSITRLYQVYTYSGIDFDSEQLHRLDIEFLLNLVYTDNLADSFLVYIPHSVVICGRMYFSDVSSDFIYLHRIIDRLEHLQLTLVYNDGAMLYQKILEID